MGSYKNQVDSTLQKMASFSHKEIVNFFQVKSYNGDVQKYWFHYYLLSHLLFFDTKHKWLNPGKIRDFERDEFSPLFHSIEHQVSKNLQTCTNKFLNELEKKLNLHSRSSSRPILLKDMKYNYELLEAISNTTYYDIIRRVLSKGDIHHYHWSAGFDYKSLYKSIKEFVDETGSNDDRVVVFKTKLAIEDPSVGGGKPADRNLVKYFFTKQKYILNLQSTKDQFKEKLESFRKNVMEGDLCLNFIKDKLGFDPSNLADPFERGFLYAASCKGTFFDDTLNTKKAKHAKQFNKLLDSLKDSTKAFESMAESLKEIPSTYMKDMVGENYSIIGVWYRFEQIFQGLSEVMDTKTIFTSLTAQLFRELKEQNVYAIEFRNKDDPFQLDVFEKESKKNAVAWSYINPGRKIEGSGSKGGKVISSALKTNSNSFAGIDFFAFEDDPYNGARDFFDLALTQLLKDEKDTYFNQMFQYLDKGGNIFCMQVRQVLFQTVRSPKNTLKTTILMII